ncbi:terminase small subunit [Microbulbifer sp. 2304DJ12-6]|uniref:terminase small subunit n=1 Tax=Microbulbifer sp. 2304DJ12-6 TaxID=3233340 RepID=UPI0039AF353F
MARRNHNGLTDKWQIFADTYLADPELNATKAYKVAYPNASQRTCEVKGSELVRKGEVAEYIQKAQKARSERTQIDADYVLKRLADIDSMEVGEILRDDMTVKPLAEWPRVWRQSISSIDISESVLKGTESAEETLAVLKKLKWPDKTKILELMGKHVNVQAFREQKEVKVTLKSLIDELIE